MYNSQYYTCEQIDQRLLQGYLDDYNTQTGQSLTKEQFLTKLGSVFAKETVIDNTAVNIGYFVCDTAAGTADKAVTAAGYELFHGGSIKVKFNNRNTAGSATLNINNKGAKALYYGGNPVSASNSWDNGEVVEIYYDGTSYYANNVEGNFKDGIFDISAYNLTEGQPTKYNTLAEALGTNGNNIPLIFRKGGMQIKYVSTSDNKYVQCRLITTSFSTDVTDWQGVDAEPAPVSENLVKSGGVMSMLANKNLYNIAGYIVADTGELASGGDTFLATDFIKIDKTVPVIVDNIGASAAAGIAFYDKDFNFIANSSQISQTSYKVEIADIPSGAEYIRSSALSSSITENTVILGASVAGLENEFAKTNIRTNQLEYNTAGSDVHIFGVNPVINYDEDNLTAVTPVTSYANTIIKDKKKGSSGFYKVDVYALSVGNSYYLSGRLAGYSTQAVIFEDITLNTPLYVLSAGNNSETGYTDIAFKITSDKTLYLGVTNDSSDTVRLSTINDIKNVDANNVNARDVTLKGISLLSILPQKEDTITPSSVITGYPQTAQRKVAGRLWQSNIYNVSNCQTVKISLSYYTSVYGIAFSTSATNTESFNENISSKEDWFVECNSTNMEIPVPIGAVYMAVAQDLSPAVVGKELVPIENNIFGPLRGKTCLFIGDSISTQNNFKWKGFLETYHRLNYVRDIANQLAPANGGITLMPYQTEPTSDEQKTIWYRCAENRMSIYTFDAVSIFGGTNDMLNPNMKVGDVTIASNGEFIDLDTILPYVDEASLFDNPSLYTDVWSTDLTFTQCLMGCVEMIHRDFPTATIILPTVMPCSDNYGGSKYTTIETSPVYGMRLSERLAIATMRVANYYKARKPERVGYVDVIGIPFYWGVRTAESYAAFTNWLPSVGTPDGVHPNVDCAKRMAGMFAEMLFI